MGTVVAIEESTNIMFPMIQSNQTKCTFCINIINFINYEIHIANGTISPIIDLIKFICKNIHNPSGNECDYIIDHIQDIINHLNHGMNSTQVCHNLTFC